MLLDQYKETGCLFNVNLTGTANIGEVYRGDLVLEIGERNERGDLPPPKVVAKQSVLLIVDDKIALLAGGLDQLSDLAMVVENYNDDLAENCICLFFVHNIKSAMTIKLGSANYILIPLDDGMIWNEILEVLCIEKSDIKSQSAEEKIVTIYKELGDFKHKYPALVYEDALGQTIEAKMAIRGAV